MYQKRFLVSPKSGDSAITSLFSDQNTPFLQKNISFELYLLVDKSFYCVFVRVLIIFFEFMKLSEVS